MKKSFLPPQSGFAVSGGGRCAEDAGDFYQNLLVTDEVIAAENEDIAIEKCPANAGFKAQDSENERQQGRPPAQPRRSPKAGCDSRTGCDGTGSA